MNGARAWISPPPPIAGAPAEGLSPYLELSTVQLELDLVWLRTHRRDLAESLAEADQLIRDVTVELELRRRPGSARGPE